MANLETQNQSALYPRTVLTPSSPMPLSRTCQNCAIAKIRCSRSRDTPICDRCQRLHKECIFRQARRRHNGTAKDLRIEALEAKVNQLLEPGTSSAAKSTSPEPPDRRNQHFRSSTVTLNEPRSPASSHSTESPPNASHRSIKDVIDAGLLTMETANSLLNRYKSEMTPCFPFVVIPRRKTAKQLRQEKPFLFLTIMAAASYDDMPLQRTLGKVVKRAVSRRMIHGEDTSFVLLQGLMVHIAWCHYHSRPRRYSQFLQLAISIIIDLRLDRPPQATSWKTPMGTRIENTSGTTFTRSSWGLDEQRAVAGCFYLSSSIAKILQKMVTLPYTVYIEDCCKSVRDAAEYATDRYLLYIVRLQRIMEKVDLLSIQQGTESVVEAYVWALKSELDVFTERLPFSLSDSFLLLTQYYTVELYLFQLSLHDPNKNIDPTRPFPWSPWRLEILCAGLMSARSMLGSFLSLPIDAGKAFNNSQWVQLGFALTVASKLSIAATEKIVARETMSYRQSLGISRLLKECILHTGSLATDFVDEHGDRDVFYHYEQRGKRIQAWYESHFPNNADITPIDTHSASSHPSSQNNVPYLPIAQDISGFTDHWTGYPNGDNSISSETYNLEMPQYLPDATIDEIMGDWISYPTNASGSVAASSSLDTQHFNVKAASHLFTAWTT